MPLAAMDLVVRPGRDDDADALIRLIGNCWAEYPGCVLDVDGEVPELRAIATYFARRDGRFWVAEGDGVARRGTGPHGAIAGCVGIAPTADPATMEMLKLYVAAPARRRGLATHLCDLAEDEARRRGARSVELWSDTRFRDAHRLYERRGYVRGPRTRELHDLSRTVEAYFARPLDGAPDGPR